MLCCREDKASAEEATALQPEKPEVSACRIRPARLEEAEALCGLCVRSKASWGYDSAFMALSRPALAVGREEIARGDVWVAVNAAGITGVVALATGEPAGTLDLGKLFVRPENLRRGVGRALLAHAIAEARRRGATRLTILADPNAAGFYEREGAKRLGDAPSDAVPGRLLPLYEVSLAAE